MSLSGTRGLARYLYLEREVSAYQSDNGGDGRVSKASFKDFAADQACRSGEDDFHYRRECKSYIEIATKKIEMSIRR